MMLRCLALCLLCCFAAAPSLRAEERSEREPSPLQRLTELKRALDEQRAALRVLDQEERALLLAASEVGRLLAAIEVQRTRAHARVLELRTSLEQHRAALEGDRAALAAVSGRLVRRLRALYVLGSGGTWRALLGTQSFEDAAWRKRLLARLAGDDARLLEEYRQARAAVRAREEAMRAEVAEAELTETALVEQAEPIAAAQRERSDALERIEAEKIERVRAVQEIVAQQRELRALIARLAAAYPARRRGRGVLRAGLRRPVEGSVLRAFGTMRDHETGAPLVSNGLHLAASLGSPVGAVAQGRVVYVGEMRGFGQIVIVDHGEGHHSLSAHLSRALVAVGDEVEQGQALALSGNSESPEGDKLYFELRENGIPIDPSPYFRQQPSGASGP